MLLAVATRPPGTVYPRQNVEVSISPIGSAREAHGKGSRPPMRNEKGLTS